MLEYHITYGDHLRSNRNVVVSKGFREIETETMLILNIITERVEVFRKYNEERSLEKLICERYNEGSNHRVK